MSDANSDNNRDSDADEQISIEEGIPPVVPIEQQPPGTRFSLTPARSIRGIIDYSTSSGRKLYEKATAKLEEDLFDCNAEDLYSFLKALKDRSREFGWDERGVGILSIPNDPIDPNEFKSLITQHGEISMENIKEFEESYITGQNRAAQDSAQLYRCLMASISKEGKRKILVWETKYTVHGLGSGNLLLKTIIRESHLDTNATSSSIRTKLTELDKYLPTVGQDITKFNTYVKLMVEGLKSRGEVTQDLLINLFKGYLTCTDKEFVSYIKRKQDKFEEGGDVDPDELMSNASDKYKTLLQKGQWNAPDENEAKIIALQAQLKKIKRDRSKAGNKSDKPDRKTAAKKPEWFDKRPKKSDLTKPREWKGKMWYYCHPDTGGKCDGKHRIHHPSKCQGNKYKFKKNDDKPTPNKKREGKEKSNDKNKKRALKLKETLRAEAATMVSQEDAKDSSSDDSSSS